MEELDKTIPIEVIDGLILAVMLIYAAARGVRIRRLAAQFYYMPKRNVESRLGYPLQKPFGFEMIDRTWIYGSNDNITPDLQK